MKKKEIIKKIIEHKDKEKKSAVVLDKILYIILGIGCLMMITFIAYFVWFTVTNKSITHFLPTQKTVAYFELEDMSLPPKLNQNTVSSLLSFNPLIQKNLKEFQDIIKGRLGAAFIQNKNNKNDLVLFFRKGSEKKTLEYFKKLGLKDEQLTISDGIYSYPQSQTFVFSFIGPYIFMAKDANAIKIIQSVFQKKTSSLNDDKDYQKTLANLPKNSWGKGYLDIKLLVANSADPLSLIVDPLKYVINHFALNIRKQQNGFHFNTLTSINPKLLPSDKVYTDSTLFTYKLADFVGSKNLAVYIGGSNLGDEWENTLKTISGLNPAYGVILEGILRAQVSKIFGDNVSLRNDIYPLLNGEYALSVERFGISDVEFQNQTKNTSKLPKIPKLNIQDSLGVKLILKHSDKKFAEIKMQKLLKGFRLLATQFAPRLKVLTLPDGKTNKELVADSAQIKETSTSYKNYTINCLDVTDSIYGFCYLVTNTLIIMASNSSSVEETIDLSSNSSNAISQSKSFKQILGKLSAVSDEITFINFDNITGLLSGFELSSVITNPFNSLDSTAWVKHYFKDGVSSEGYLLLK